MSRAFHKVRGHVAGQFGSRELQKAFAKYDLSLLCSAYEPVNLSLNSLLKERERWKLGEVGSGFLYPGGGQMLGGQDGVGAFGGGVVGGEGIRGNTPGT